MKKHLKALITAGLILTAAVGLSVSCLAFDNTDNTEIKEELQEVADSYYQKEEGTTSPETSTYNAVKEYVDNIDRLRQITDRDTTVEMELEYKKGTAVGILSWIYYYHIGEIEELSEADAQAISTVYRAQKGVIDSGERDFFDGKGVTVCYTKLLNEIYARKIEMLRSRDNGNGLVAAKVDRALELVHSRCSYLESYGEDAQNCKNFYAEVTARVELQEYRDITIAELEAVVGGIYPDKELDMREDGEYKTFFDQINSPSIENAYVAGTYGDGQVIAELNRALGETVCGMLADSPELGEYMRAYYGELRRSVAERVAQTNAEGKEKQVLLRDLFEGFSMGYAVAEAKDRLTDYVRGDIFTEIEVLPLDRIVAEYTGNGTDDGIFDGADSVEAVAGELFKAKARCYWYATYRKALERIVEYVEPSHKIANDATSYYESVDAKISAGEYGDSGAEEELLAPDTAALYTLIAKAEATEFYNENKEIIHKVLSENFRPSSADRSTLIKAIEGSDFLYPETESIVAEVLEALGKSYKELIASEILSLVRGDGAEELRRAAAEKLCRLVEALEAKNSAESFVLSELMESADLYLKKAEIVKELFDGYISEYLVGGSEYFGERAEDVAEQGTEKIIENADGDGRQKMEEALTALKRLAALEDIYTFAKGYETLQGISELLSSAVTEIEACATDTSIGSYAAKRIEEISEIIRRGEIADAVDTLCKLDAEIKNRIEGYGYISDTQRQELLTELEEIINNAKETVETAPDGLSVRARFEEARIALSDFESRANNCELDACLAAVISDLNAAYGEDRDYSAENLVLILQLISRYEDELEAVRGIDEYIEIRNRAVAEILSVEDLLETAKRVGAERLAAAYAELMAKKHCYSADRLSELLEIYTHSVAELDGFEAVPEDAERIYRLVEERISLMRGVRLEKLYTSDGLLATENERVYPDGYSIADKGYIGAIRSENGLPSDTELIIEMTDTKGIVDIIRKAAKDGKVLMGGSSVTRRILRALRSAEILLGAHIEVGKIPTEGDSYRVSILLPKDLEGSDIFGVALIGADGTVELLEAVPDARLLEFDTVGLSDYYVLKKGAINLVPLIICLSIIILCELCAIGLLLFRRRRHRLSELCGIIPIPFLLAIVYRPKGGNITAALLGLTAAALGGVIGYLVYLEIKAAKGKKAHAPKRSEKLISDAVPVTLESSLIPADASEVAGSPSPEYKAAVSVEEADALMSDGEAEQLSEKNTAVYVDNEIYRGEKKAEINIDTISESFEDGATVTLNSLKEKRLIPRNAGQVKILARGVLDKRLCVVAQDFSRAAVKMILLTGGEAIFTYSSAERGGKKKN